MDHNDQHHHIFLNIDFRPDSRPLITRPLEGTSVNFRDGTADAVLPHERVQVWAPKMGLKHSRLPGLRPTAQHLLRQPQHQYKLQLDRYSRRNLVLHFLASYLKVPSKIRRLPHLLPHPQILCSRRSSLHLVWPYFHSFHSFRLHLILSLSLAVCHIQTHLLDSVLHQLLQCNLWKFCCDNACQPNLNDIFLLFRHSFHHLCLQWDVSFSVLFLRVE